MSNFFNRSRDTLKQYFSQKEEFEKNLAKYRLADGVLFSSKRYGCAGKGGVPLSYSESESHDSSYVSVDDSDVHTLVIGATASKKSRLVAMPMVKILQSAKESLIIVDPKAEIFERTSESLRKSGYTVNAIDLRNPHLGNAWNPLSIPYALYIKNGDNDIDRACEFVNDIANNLAKMESANDKDPFWENSAASFFFGLIMLLFMYASEKKMSAEYVNIRNVLKLRSVLCKDYYAGQKTTDAVEYAKTDSFVYSLLIGTLETAQTTQAGILSTFDQKMRTFAIQPSLLDLLASDDKVVENVQHQPTAVFLIVPDEKTSYHNLVSLFIKQSYEYFIYTAQNSDHSKGRIRVNYILDEFSSLPTINDFPAMITAARSRDIRFTLFIQSKHQLDLRYRQEAETIRANCSNWIFLVSREVMLLQELSTLCGMRRLSDGALVPVLSITDLQRFSKEKGEALILSGRQKPFISRLLDIKYFDNDKFKKPNRKTQVREHFEINFEFPSVNKNKPPFNLNWDDTFTPIQLPKLGLSDDASLQITSPFAKDIWSFESETKGLANFDDFFNQIEQEAINTQIVSAEAPSTSDDDGVSTQLGDPLSAFEGFLKQLTDEESAEPELEPESKITTSKLTSVGLGVSDDTSRPCLLSKESSTEKALINITDN